MCHGWRCSLVVTCLSPPWEVVPCVNKFWRKFSSKWRIIVCSKSLPIFRACSVGVLGSSSLGVGEFNNAAEMYFPATQIRYNVAPYENVRRHSLALCPWTLSDNWADSVVELPWQMAPLSSLALFAFSGCSCCLMLSGEGSESLLTT